MNKICVKAVSVLLLTSPSLFFAMQKPGTIPMQQATTDVVEQIFKMDDEGWVRFMAMDEIQSLAPEARANLESMVGLIRIFNNLDQNELELALRQVNPEMLRTQARTVAGRIAPSIEEIIEQPAATTTYPTRAERLQAYWNNLHPVVKAGVVGTTALATSYGAKKLYEFMQKRK